MTLQESVQEALKKFENTIPPEQKKTVVEARKIFEEMVARGLVERPSYKLPPMGPLYTRRVK